VNSGSLRCVARTSDATTSCVKLNCVGTAPARARSTAAVSNAVVFARSQEHTGRSENRTHASGQFSVPNTNTVSFVSLAHVFPEMFLWECIHGLADSLPCVVQSCGLVRSERANGAVEHIDCFASPVGTSTAMLVAGGWSGAPRRLPWRALRSTGTHGVLRSAQFLGAVDGTLCSARPKRVLCAVPILGAIAGAV
jgi:hypothetical protein